MKKNILKVLSAVIAGLLGVSQLYAQNFPKDGTEAQEIAIGGPSKDYLTLEFPRPGVAKCAPFSAETRTIGGDLAKGKALLVVIFPKDCPYCIEAADKADAVIDKYRDKLTLWYVNQRLNGEGSCGDITEMSNKYKFVRNADFKFIDIYMWNNAWGTPWHYGAQDSYFSRPGSPSVYRIFDPKSKKVTAMAYGVDGIDGQIAAAVKNNFLPTGAERATANLSSYEMYPNPAKESLNLNINLKNSGNTIVSIKNNLGVEVLRKELGNASSFNEVINLEQLQSDMYHIQVISEGVNIINDKFVKQ